MRRVICVCALVVVASCGGGGGGKGTHPDASGDGSVGADRAMDAAGSGGDVPSADAAVGDLASEAGDAASSGDGGEIGDIGATDGTDGAPDAASDVVADAVTDVGAEAEAAPRLVTVVFTGKVVTVAGTPLGLDGTARLTPVSGSFTYDLRLVDDEPADPKRGKFWRAGTTAFSFAVATHHVAGSGRSIAVTEDLNPDTFRFLDGPQGDAVVRIMKLDDVDAPALKLFIAITDSSGAMLASDLLPDPFPAIDITKLPHTFSLMDDGGSLLMQLDTLANQ